jgi:DNA replication protein DnaC
MRGLGEANGALARLRIVEDEPAARRTGVFRGCAGCGWTGFAPGTDGKMRAHECSRARLWDELAAPGIGVPGRYRGATVGDVRADAGDEGTAGRAELARRVTEDGRSAFLYGGVGTGKTFLAMVTAREHWRLREAGRLLQALKGSECANCEGCGCEWCGGTGFSLLREMPQPGWEHGVIVTTGSDMEGRWKASFGQGGTWRVSGPLKGTGLLVVDEFGSRAPAQGGRLFPRSGGEWLVEEWFGILNERYANQRPTVLISNLDPVDMQEWSPRLWSRITEDYEILHAGGKDRRGNAGR